MMSLEASPNRILDPEFFPVGTVDYPDADSITYFLNSQTWEVRTNPDYLDLPKGGILAEGLGSGKTLVCIALIVCTLDQPTCLPFTVPSHDSRGVPTKSWTSTDEVGLAQTGRRTNKGVTYHVSQGTLIVVPGLLVNHWSDECKKHLPEDTTLKILCVYTKSQIPARTKRNELLDYDIVIIDRNVLKEDKEYMLSETYWKRIFFDEGNFAGVVTESDTIRLLRADSRWLVSGMLTDNLRQGFGAIDESARVNYQRPDDDADSDDDVSLPDETEDSAEPKLDGVDGGDQPYSPYDLNDLQRLGNMIGVALGADQPGSKSFARSLDSALIGRSEKHIFGVVYRIREIMQALIVKHPEEVVAEESPLPALTLEKLVIPLDPLQQMSYNLRISTIKLNGIDFKPHMAGHLLNSKLYRDSALASLQLTTTWSAEPDMSAVSVMHDLTATKYELDEDEQADEIKRCNEIYNHLDKAQRSKDWRPITQMSTGSVALQLRWTADPIQQSFADVIVSTKNHIYIDAWSLSTLQNFNRQGTSVKEMIGLGTFTKANKREAAKAMHDAAVAEGRIHGSAGRNRKEAVEPPRKAATKKKKKAVSKKAKATLKIKAEEQAEKLRQEADEKRLQTDQPGLPRPCISENEVTIRSGKLSKVAELLKGCEADDRFVIFGMNEELGLVAELFEIFNITYTSVTTSKQSPTMRSSRLESFKNDPKIRALLLEPVWGATGLDLTCANRMIFLSENWTGHEINQGIKRIHRNGQTRPTTVYTLIAKDTFEDKDAHPYPERLKRNWQERVLRQPHFCTEAAKPDYNVMVSLEPQPDQRALAAAATKSSKKRKADVAEVVAPAVEKSLKKDRRQLAVEVEDGDVREAVQMEKLSPAAGSSEVGATMEVVDPPATQEDGSGRSTRRLRRKYAD